MATSTLSLTGMPSTQPIPGDFVEVRFAQGQSAGDAGVKKVLLIGPKLSTGTITADTEIGGPYGSSDEVSDVTGVGSVAHRMAKKFFQIAGAGGGAFELYVICPTESAGAQATGVITYATTPTAAGVASVIIAGVQYDYSYTASDTVTTIAAGLKVAINNDPDAPVTAGNALGVLTATAKNKGLEGNTIRFYGRTTPGTAVTASVTTSTAFTGGTSSAAYTTVLASILGQKFDYIVPHCTDTTALDAIKTQITTQALPATGFRQKVLNGQVLDASSAITLASARNHERIDFANLESSEVESYIVGAAFAAVRVLNEITDPSFNFDGYGTKGGTSLPIPAPSKKADWFTTTEQSTMLQSGVTPIAVDARGNPYIVRSVTSRCMNGSNYDYRVRDSVRVCVADRLAADWIVRISTAGYSKLTSDPLNQGQEPDGNFATPRRGKAIAEQLVSDYCSNGWLDPGLKATMLAGISTAIDANNASALNVRIPIYVVNMLHQTRTLVAESSPAV